MKKFTLPGSSSSFAFHQNLLKGAFLSLLYLNQFSALSECPAQQMMEKLNALEPQSELAASFNQGGRGS